MPASHTDGRRRFQRSPVQARRLTIACAQNGRTICQKDSKIQRGSGSTNRKLADTQADSQPSQLTDQLSYEINGCLIGQPAFCIKLCLGVCYVDVRCIHWDHIQRHADVTEVKLPARSAERTHRCTEHCARLAVCW